MSSVTIIENPSEIGAGTRGASLGIAALKVAARNRNSTYFGQYESVTVPDENNLLDTPTPFPYARRIDGLLKVYERTAEAVASTLDRGQFPLVLSGDHACAGGTIAGLKRAFPHRRIGVIWIDAHADVHSPYTTPSGNVHGMPLATALGVDHTAAKVNPLDEATVNYWNQLKEVGGQQAKLHPEDVVFVAVRDTEPAEVAFMEQQGMRNYSVDEVRRNGAASVVLSVKEQLAHCDVVYLSFDVDAMDCEVVSRGTGTPVPRGLTPEEAQFMMVHFAQWPKVKCAEIVEINPCLDDKVNRMAEVTYDIMEAFTPVIENRDKR